MPADNSGLTKIVEKCKEIRFKAKRLVQQAEADLESAKRRIEAMLPGEPYER